MVNYKEGEKSEKWTPMKALGNVRRKLESDLQVSSFDYDIDKAPKIPLEDFASSSNERLESYLAMFCGYTSYYEAEVAKRESTLFALQAAYDDGTAKAINRIAKDREEAKKPKGTQQELRGEVLDSYPQLWQLRKEVIETEAAVIHMRGVLKAYDKVYAAVSSSVSPGPFGYVFEISLHPKIHLKAVIGVPP